jgi:hypothetical protein
MKKRNNHHPNFPLPEPDKLTPIRGDYDREISKPKMVKFPKLKDLGCKSVMTFRHFEKDEYSFVPDETPYFNESDMKVSMAVKEYYGNCDFIFMTKEKEEILEMWKNKKFKSLVESSNGTTPHSDINDAKEGRFKKYHDLLVKGIFKNIRLIKSRSDGVVIGILNDVDDFNIVNCTPNNSILLGMNEFSKYGE